MGGVFSLGKPRIADERETEVVTERGCQQRSYRGKPRLRLQHNSDRSS